MKMSLKSLAAAITHPVLFFRDRTSLLLTKVRGSGKNRFICKNAAVKKCDIRFRGMDNSIELNGCDLFNSRIFLRGKGHRLVIERDVKRYNVYIKIIGSGNTVIIGKETTLGGGNIICGGSGIPIRIGEACVIAEGVDIWATDTHSIYQEGILTNEPAPIIIGNHVWLGKDVAILKGTSIGDGAVIGMRSLVTRDIPAATLSTGSPARVIRENVSWSIDNPDNARDNS